MSIKKFSNIIFKAYAERETKKEILENFVDTLPVLTRFAYTYIYQLA